MKKILLVLLVLAMVMAIAVPAFALPVEVDSITKGEVKYSSGHYLAGEPIPVGFDPYGYNYQAHMFSGSYANSYLGGAGFPPWEGNDEVYLAENPTAENHWAWPYRETTLIMKWNDAWLSNVDRDLDGKLDRSRDNGGTYIGSGAWLTNHQFGDDWNYFVKIVAPPADAVETGGVWYTAEGAEIGPVIWGSFAKIQTVSNDPENDEHGLLYSGDRPALGGW